MLAKDVDQTSQYRLALPLRGQVESSHRRSHKDLWWSHIRVHTSSLPQDARERLRILYAYETGVIPLPIFWVSP